MVAASPAVRMKTAESGLRTVAVGCTFCALLPVEYGDHSRVVRNRFEMRGDSVKAREKQHAKTETAVAAGTAVPCPLSVIRRTRRTGSPTSANGFHGTSA